MSNETEALRRDMSVMLFKLEALEAKEKKMWVIPNGEFFITGDGDRCKQGNNSNSYTKYGTTRNTKAELEDLRQKQEFLNISHAFACANDGVQEFVLGEENWCVSKEDGEIIAGIYSFSYEFSTVCMTEKDAKEFARLCKANLIPFQYQE